jgi:hypothetical protein
MSLAELARAHRLRQQAIASLTLNRVRRLWRMLDPGKPQASWDRVAPQVVTAMVAAQLEAARGVDDYVSAALTLQGATPDPVGRVTATAFAGMASDGRDLVGLLSYPAFQVSAFVDQGMDPTGALAIGGRHMDRMALTQVADAARVSTGVAQVNDRTVKGWVRMVTPPSCSRCIVLAGKFYRVNRGFQRHPHCDCVHMPSAEVIEPQSPKALFDAMSPAEQDRAFTKAGAQAVRDGADISQVVNARRGMETAGVSKTRVNDQGRVVNERHKTLVTRRVLGRDAFTTTEGVTKRGLRLMPEQIYAEADRLGWSREETIRQLKRFGFIL